jgi:hypothetical protein
LSGLINTHCTAGYTFKALISLAISLYSAPPAILDTTLRRAAITTISVVIIALLEIISGPITAAVVTFIPLSGVATYTLVQAFCRAELVASISAKYITIIALLVADLSSVTTNLVTVVLRVLGPS